MSMFINHTWYSGGGQVFSSTNPATGATVWCGHAANAADVDAAVSAARRAVTIWSHLPLDERIVLLQRFAELVTEHREALAHAIGVEIGKPLWEARQEVQTMGAKIDIAIAAYAERSGEKWAQAADGTMQHVCHRPHGVLAVLGPYNFPGHLPNAHIVPALLAGNTVVFKPSELAPGVAEYTVKLWQQAGLPAGVLNLIPGGRETGRSLAEHPGLNGLLFTGSAATGYALHRQLSGRPEFLLALEMGGNNPLIVAATTEIDAAIHYALLSAFLSAGQRCTCARRIFVPNNAFGKHFIEGFVTASTRIRIGPYNAEPQAFMGPVITRAMAVKLVEAQDRLLELGGQALLPLQQPKADLGFVTAGIVDMTMARDRPDEEFFGPLVQLVRYDDFKTAIAQANQTAYGLSAALLADSLALWEAFSSDIRAGIVNWNRPTTGALSSAPFGGIGRSGNHRPSGYYAADYCAYPIAGVEAASLAMPATMPPGLS